MSISLGVPPRPVFSPRITVFGVGGAGGNAVNNMIRKQLAGAEFVVGNTDAQALDMSETDKRVQFGPNITQGLGAGSVPSVGKAAAEEVINDIMAQIDESNMVFIAAGMGGGTGTGAAPIVARAAKEMNKLTVGVVTKPFEFEGTQRMQQAEKGIAELETEVDTLIVIPNQNLFRIANERTTLTEAFLVADEVLHAGVQGVTDLMIRPGLVNLDFADVRAVMSDRGKAVMGTGEGSGEHRGIDAAEAAIANPLLDEMSLKGACAVLINITSTEDVSFYEVDEAVKRIRDEVDPNAALTFGAVFDETMGEKLRISVIATGMDAASEKRNVLPFSEHRREPQTNRGSVQPLAAQDAGRTDVDNPAPRPIDLNMGGREPAPVHRPELNGRIPRPPIQTGTPHMSDAQHHVASTNEPGDTTPARSFFSRLTGASRPEPAKEANETKSASEQASQAVAEAPEVAEAPSDPVMESKPAEPTLPLGETRDSEQPAYDIPPFLRRQFD